MEKCGILDVAGAACSIDDTKLARCGESDPFGAAVRFVQNAGFRDGDRVCVNGTSGTIGGVSVLCITAIRSDAAALSSPFAATAAVMAKAKKAPARPAADEPTAKAAKKVAPKRAAKKSPRKMPRKRK